MNIEAITEQIRIAATKAPSMGKTMKLQLDEGVVLLDMTGDTAVVSNDDKEADCTIIMSSATLQGLRDGSVNPMMAVMGGKIKIKGDMGLAMKLQSLLS